MAMVIQGPNRVAWTSYAQKSEEEGVDRSETFDNDFNNGWARVIEQLGKGIEDLGSHWKRRTNMSDARKVYSQTRTDSEF
jgi:hypothetical protein